MTSRNNDQGPRPTRPAGEGAANGSTSRTGNGRRNVDQGDLWSDAPSTPATPPRDATPVRPEPRPRPSENPPPTDETPPLREPTEPAEDTAVRERAPVNGTRVAGATPSPRSARPVARSAPVSTPRPVTRRVEPPPPIIEEPEYEEDDEGLYYEEPASMLRNPYVLAGLAVAVAIVLAVIIVFVFGKGGDGAGGATGASGPSGSSAIAANPTAQSTVPTTTGLQVKSLTTATVHAGPGLDFLDVGLLRSNQDVQVVGRNDDASWYEIIFPPGSNFGGWVVASALKLPSDAASKVAVAQPTPVPRPDVPATSTAVPVTPTPIGDADIAIHVAPVCQADKPVAATIDNTGEVPLNDVSIRVLVSQDGKTLYDATYKVSMQPGQSVQPDIQTNAVAPTITVAATLVGADDVNPGNNTSTCTVGNVSNNQNNSVPPPVSTKTAAPTSTPRNSNDNR